MIATGNHPFPTPAGTKAAFDLEAGDQVQVISGVWTPIASIEMIPAGEEKPIVWNVELDGPDTDESHFVVANGLVAGDLWIQSRLQNQQGAK